MNQVTSAGQRDQSKCSTVASGNVVPVYDIRNCGPRHRFGANGKLVHNCNWLNFKRGSPIRRAVKAPQGFYLAPIDASQIEFRVCCYLAGQNDVVEQLRRGEDPYIGIASQFYGEQIYKPEKDDPRRLEMEQKRGAGKQAKLMCQYGASGKQFQATAKSGQYGPPINMTLDQAEAFVQLYRRTHPAICAPRTGYWAQCERILARLAGGEPMMFGPMLIKDHRIYIEGAPMIYDTIEYFGGDVGNPKTGWRVKKRDGWRFIWGSKLTQNICEGVSRMIVSQAMIRIKKKYGIRTLNWPYDELLLLIPKDGREEEMLQLCIAEMTVEPTWLPGIPLAAEGHLGAVYEK